VVPIRRVGLPIALQGLGPRYLIAIHLSTSPPLQWRQLFRCASRDPSCEPGLVRMVGDRMTFVAAEDEIEQWLACLDRWIDETNQRWAAAS
jgi:hypothetical protein